MAIQEKMQQVIITVQTEIDSVLRDIERDFNYDFTEEEKQEMLIDAFSYQCSLDTLISLV